MPSLCGHYIPSEIMRPMTLEELVQAGAITMKTYNKIKKDEKKKEDQKKAAVGRE